MSEETKKTLKERAMGVMQTALILQDLYTGSNPSMISDRMNELAAHSQILEEQAQARVSCVEPSLSPVQDHTKSAIMEEMRENELKAGSAYVASMESQAEQRKVENDKDDQARKFDEPKNEITIDPPQQDQKR